MIRAKIGPVITVAPTCLGLVLSKTNLVIASSPDLNSGLISSNYIIADKNKNLDPSVKQKCNRELKITLNKSHVYYTINILVHERDH